MLGTQDIVLKSYDDLEFLCSKYAGLTAPVSVYSTLFKTVREVRLEIKDNWGGPGRLGCDVGHGLLHRLPAKSPTAKSVPTPDEEFETYNEPIPIEVRSANGQEGGERRKCPSVVHLDFLRQLDESGTVSFLLSILVPTTEQMITVPVVIYPTEFDYASFHAAQLGGSSPMHSSKLAHLGSWAGDGPVEVPTRTGRLP